MKSRQIHTRIKRQVWGILIAGVVVAQSALAFPSWIGVFPPYERHVGYNPGMFTVLMNQDYYGLHAEVWLKVTGADWDAVTMEYRGNQSGNSLWQCTPPGAFPVGAEVVYYFHGWDDWGGEIWDSNDMNNYIYETEAGVIIEPGDDVQFDYISVYGGQGSYQEVAAAIVHPLGLVAIHNTNTDITVKRLTLTRTSVSVLDTVAVCTAGADATNLTLAAVDNSVVVAYSDAANVVIYHSQTGGGSFTGPITLTLNQPVLELKATSFGSDNLALAILIGSERAGQQVYASVSSDGGQTWASPVLVGTAHYTGYYAQLSAGGNPDGLYLAWLHQYLNIYYQPLYTIPAAYSSDGVSWSTSDGAYTNDAIDRVAQSVTDAGAIVSWNEAIAGQSTVINVKIRRNLVGTWSSIVSSIGQAFSSAPPQSWNTFGGPDQGVFLLYQDQQTYRVSSDGSLSWRSMVQLPEVMFGGTAASIHCMIPGPHAAYLVYMSGLSSAQALMWRVLEQTFNLRGDVNNDWTITAGDAQTAFAIALGAYSPDQGETWRADATQDFSFSAADAQCIFMEVLGMPNSCFPE